jgi:hypothetical protein
MFKIFKMWQVVIILWVKSIITRITKDEYWKPYYRLLRFDTKKTYQVDNEQLQLYWLI